MILSKTVIINIAGQGKYWEAKGYGKHKQGEKIEVKIDDLSRFSCIKIISKCDECGKEWKQQYQRAIYGILNGVKGDKIHRCNSCTRKAIGKVIDSSKNIARLKLRLGPLHPNWKGNKSAGYIEYAAKVRMLAEQNYVKYKSVINPNNFKRSFKNEDDSYFLNYKIKVIDGFNDNIDPEIIGSIDNLYMESWLSINKNKIRNKNIL